MVAVLQYLHCVQMGVKVGEEVVCEPPCCVHRVFGMNICSRVIIISLSAPTTSKQRYPNLAGILYVRPSVNVERRVNQ